MRMSILQFVSAYSDKLRCADVTAAAMDQPLQNELQY